MKGFWAVVEALGEGWKIKYWKRPDASLRTAERKGYVIREGALTLKPRATSRGKKKSARHEH